MTKKFKETTDKIFEETEERKAARDLEEDENHKQSCYNTVIQGLHSAYLTLTEVES